jgi:hypothetical protein
MAKESVEELLKQAIAASDRTTFAIRAFVLFLFLQLAFTSIAAVFVWFGYTAYNGFGWVIVGLVIFALGVIVSSVVGWSEIGMSGVGLDYKEQSDVLSRVTSDNYGGQDPGGTGYSYWECGKCKSSFELKEVGTGACPTCEIPMRRVWEQ